MKISIVIPAHNEEDNIINLIKNIENTLDFDHVLVIINDHSTDATAELVRKISCDYKNINLIENNLDRGFANALKTGFNNSNTEVVVSVMADLCDDLLTIKKMLSKINEGYDVVCSSRYIKGGARIGGSRIKGFFSWFVGWSLYHILRIPTHDVANAFKMYKKEVIDYMDIKSKGFEISMEIPLKAYYKGFKITEVPTVWRERTKGKSNFHMLRLLSSYLKLYIWAIFKRFSSRETPQ